MKRRVLIILSAILVLIIAITSTSCSSKNYSSDNVMAETYASYAYDYEAEAKYYDVAAEMAVGNSSYSYKSTATATAITDTRKIIKSISMSLETLEFDIAVEEIKASVINQGGYVESSNVSGRSINDEYNQRYASFVLRIPADKLTSYVDSLNEKYNVLYLNENSSDITDTYYDAEARLKSLLTQEERLLSMLEGATELQYMLQLENTLADVRYQIENYYSTLSRYDNQVAMSTVSISLQEVVKYQTIIEPPKTFGQRLGSAISGSWNNFVEGLQDFIIDFTYALPGLIIFALIIFAFIFILIKLIKRANKKRNEKSSL